MKALGVACALLAAACGGKAILDAPSATGGAGGTTSTTTTTTTTTTGGCHAHSDCPGGVCVFADGTCVAACDSFSPCPVAQVCNPCITSSCPGCEDCVGGCQPAKPGQCDDHDDCGAGQVCLYGAQQCAPPCTSTGCADPNLVCNPCATSSCPGCADCVGACTESF